MVFENLPESKIIILPLCMLCEEPITRSLLYKADEFLQVQNVVVSCSIYNTVINIPDPLHFL